MFENVLIAIDGSQGAVDAALEVQRLGLLKNAKRVGLVSILELAPWLRYGDFSDSHKMAHYVSAFREEFVAPLISRLKGLGVDVSEAKVIDSDEAAESITALAKEEGYDLLVLGRRGMGKVKRFLLGSVSRKVAQLSKVPVLVVPSASTRFRPGAKIVAPTDFSPLSQLGLSLASRLAKSLEAKVLLVHCTTAREFLLKTWVEGGSILEADYRALFKEYEAGLEKRFEEAKSALSVHGGEVEGIVKSSSWAGESIAEIAEEEGAAVIVMTSHGRSGFKKIWLGSVAEKVLKLAPCPVLIVKPDKD